MAGLREGSAVYLKGLPSVGQELIPALIKLSLADWALLTDGDNRFAPEPFEDNGGLVLESHSPHLLGGPSLLEQPHCTKFLGPLSYWGTVYIMKTNFGVVY